MILHDKLQPVTPTSHPPSRRWLGHRSYWIAQAAGWGIYLALDSLSLLASPQASRYDDLAEALAVTFFGLITTHFFRVAILQLRRSPLGWVGLALRLAPWWLLFSLVLATALAVSQLLWIQASSPGSPSLVSGGTYALLSLYSRCLFFIGIWVGLYFGYNYYHQYRESLLAQLTLEARMQAAELKVLKAQLNPHFLFNALNTIRALTPKELAAPRRAVTSLSELLRASLSLSQTERVSLAQELEVVEHYLTLETLRFENRLRVERDIDPAALDWQLPPFALQTLVENAVNHGIAQLPEGGSISIRAAVQDGLLRIVVDNPGHLLPNRRSTGLGLQNARSRLALLFGPTASLDLDQSSPGRVSASLVLPRRSLSSQSAP